MKNNSAYLILQRKLVEAKEKAEAEDGNAMTIDEIFDSIVPSKKGYVQGRGSYPKPISTAYKVLEQRQKEAEERAKAAESMNEELLKQVAELKARQDEFEKSLFDKIRADVQQHFNQAGLNINTFPSFMGSTSMENGE